MRFSVCIPAIRPTTVETPIQSIRRQTISDWELVVVGQGDDEPLRAVVERIAADDSRIRYVHIERPGTNRARNAAISAARGDVIAILDDDCTAREDWLAVFQEYLDAEPEVGLIGGALVAPPRSRGGIGTCPQFTPSEALYDPRASFGKAPAGWDWISSSVAIRKSVAEATGPFDEALGGGTEFPAGCDTDFKLRLESRGIKMRSTPRAVVEHTHGWRYGLSAALHLQASYAIGNGGLAGKLTLLRDPRGHEWLEITRRRCTTRWLRDRKPQNLPSDLRQLWFFRKGYDHCLRNYTVDDSGLLRRTVA